MNAFEIAELFIQAADIDQRLPVSTGPAKLKAMAFPYVHDVADMNGWPAPHKKGAKISDMIRRKREAGDQLDLGDNGRMDQDMLDFWEGKKAKIKPEDVTNWERCNELIKLVANEPNRRCLWAWAQSKIGSLKVAVAGKRYRTSSFAKWCKSEGIHEETGRRRKDRAILTIEAHFVRNMLQNNDNSPLSLLPTGVVEEHISDTIAADAPKINKRAWMADSAFSSPILADGEYTFEWAEKRNEARRQRRAAAMKKQAA